MRRENIENSIKWGNRHRQTPVVEFYLIRQLCCAALAMSTTFEKKLPLGHFAFPTSIASSFPAASTCIDGSTCE